MPLSLTIVTPEKNIVKDLSVDEIVMPAGNGEVTILPGHTPVLTTLGAGLIRTDAPGEERDINFLVDYGFAEIRDDKVNIFAENLEPATEIDLEKAEKSQAEAEETGMSKILGELEYAKYMKQLEITHKRVEIAKLAKSLSGSNKKKN